METAGGLLAAGAGTDARAVLNYLSAIQEADGHWVQNAWLDGRPYWHGIQMDETAFPILLYDMLLRAGEIDASGAGRYLPMIEAAAWLYCQKPVPPPSRIVGRKMPVTPFYTRRRDSRVASRRPMRWKRPGDCRRRNTFAR